MLIELIVGLCAGTLCMISFIPQVIKIYRDKHARDLSMPTFCMFTLGVFLWLIYGIIIKSIPIMITNSLMTLLSLAIVILKCRYKD
jgi:MtN3 and saliva related transmembrane protein